MRRIQAQRGQVLKCLAKLKFVLKLNPAQRVPVFVFVFFNPTLKLFQDKEAANSARAGLPKSWMRLPLQPFCMSAEQRGMQSRIQHKL